jgi:hypothetical protein
MTRPGAERTTALPAPPAQAAAQEGDTADRRMKDHLRRVQRKAGVDPAPDDPPEGADDGWRRWLPH